MENWIKKICLRWMHRQIKKEIVRNGTGLPPCVMQDVFRCITSAPPRFWKKRLWVWKTRKTTMQLDEVAEWLTR